MSKAAAMGVVEISNEKTDTPSAKVLKTIATKPRETEETHDAGLEQGQEMIWSPVIFPSYFLV
jgi:hypothetical protein